MCVVVCTKKKLKYVVNYYSKKLRQHMYIKGILMADFLFTATCHNSISRVL